MSRQALTVPPLLVFASPDGASWGVAAGGEPARVAAGPTDAPGPAEVGQGRLQRGGNGAWEFQRDSGALMAVEQPADVRSEQPDPDLALVRLSGSGEAVGIAYGGRAGVEADSVRMLFAWFPGESAVGVLAVRPDRSKGQDRDMVSVACLGEPPSHRAFDPRLSITYGGEGQLRRLGVELWLGESEDADLRSLRVAGEASPAIARLEVDGAGVQAQPLQAHSRGQSGVGVYVQISRE